ncbi:hypothetical protein BD414DRAFT_518212 [Trametes punicea]|nr:hypothetical protein BD414DRAFT_518212 [Trametes punicea]
MWDSDMSDLTPFEDSTDEGESEVDSSEDESEDEPLANTQGKDGAPPSPPPTPNPVKHRGICATVGCANFMPECSRLRTCTKCRLADRKAKRHLKRRMLMAQIHDDADEIQAHYLRFEAQQGDGALGDSRRNRHPMVFRFDGEYSIVADPAGGVVDAVVQCVWRNVRAALGLPFTSVGVNAGLESSVVAVFLCVYAAQFPLLNSPPSTSTSSASATPAPEAEVQPAEASEQTFQVKMVGELQVCVAWDRRHKYFPGQRILVRFRLVGLFVDSRGAVFFPA